jgi:hypothetical protein
MTDRERPKWSTNRPLVRLSDENLAFAEAIGVNPASHTSQKYLKECRK